MQEGQSLFGMSELVSGWAGLLLDLSEWPSGLAEELFGWAGCLLGLAGLQGWAGSVGFVSGSLGFASLSWAQNAHLRWTKGETRFHLSGKCPTLERDLVQTCTRWYYSSDLSEMCWSIR